MTTVSSCSLNTLAGRQSLPDSTVTNLLKTLACYSQGQSFCKTDGGLEFCTKKTEVVCTGGDDSQLNLNKTIPPVKCQCLGLGSCFCSFGCSLSFFFLLAYVGFFVFCQIFRKKCKILDLFSLKVNWFKIFPREQPHHLLYCLDWLRVFSTCSVLMGHFHQIISKVYTLPDQKHSFFTMLLLHNMNLAVESFLFLGGLLSAYTWMLKHKAKPLMKRNSLFWFRLFFGRWYRLVPALGSTIVISNVISHLVMPELWMGSSDPKLDCSNTWPTMLSFTNNYVPNTCMRWLWYLAIDMQLYFGGILFLLGLEKYGYKKVMYMSVFVIVVSLSYRGHLAQTLDVPIMYLADAPVWEPIMQQIYVKPFPRLSSYVIGLMLGSKLDSAVDFVAKTKKVPMITLGSLVLLAYAYFGGFYEYFFDVDSYHRVIYLAIFRTVFALGVSWLALMCTSRHVAFFVKLNKLCFWAPMAKLTFAAYLLHPMVIGSVVQMLLYSFVPLSLNIDLVLAFGGIVAVLMVLSVSGLFCLVIELPMAALRPTVEQWLASALCLNQKDKHKKVE